MCIRDSPEGVFTKSSTLARFPIRALYISVPGMIIVSRPCSRIRMVLVLDTLLRHRIAGKFRPGPSTTSA
eukprot:7261103-Pyramimonas_sp.AAC.1